MGSGVPTRIRDGTGQGYEAQVTSGHALRVSIADTSATEISNDELTRFKILRGQFLNVSGSTGMNVDGSTTPVEFTIAADTGRVKYIQGVRFILNGVNLEIDTQDARRFGAATAVGTALTNGIEFEVKQGASTVSLFVDPVTRLIEFLNYADDFTNLKNSISAQSDFISFDFEFIKPIVLPAGSTDAVIIRIRDDLTALDLFNAFVYRGYQEEL